MSDVVIPEVTVVDIAVPGWAQAAIRDKRHAMFRPDCIMVVCIHYSIWLYLGVDEWQMVSVLVDDEEVGYVQCPPGDAFFATGMTDGRHTIRVKPDDERDEIDPVALDIGAGTVVLVEIDAKHSRWFRWLGGRQPSVKLKVLPAGFAHNGRWGERWSRRLGWSGQADAPTP